MPSDFQFYRDELSEQLKDVDATCTAERWFGAGYWVAVLGDVWSDVQAAFRKIAGKAHAAEVNALEAVKALDEAQSPDSPGGTEITPQEAKKVRRLTVRTADMAHEVAEEVA